MGSVAAMGGSRCMGGGRGGGGGGPATLLGWLGPRGAMAAAGSLRMGWGRGGGGGGPAGLLGWLGPGLARGRAVACAHAWTEPGSGSGQLGLQMWVTLNFLLPQSSQGSMLFWSQCSRKWHASAIDSLAIVVKQFWHALPPGKMPHSPVWCNSAPFSEPHMHSVLVIWPHGPFQQAKKNCLALTWGGATWGPWSPWAMLNPAFAP